MTKSLDDLAMEYALNIPVNPGFEKNMYVSNLEMKANSLFKEMEKLAGPVAASAAITQARYTLKMVNALPKDPDHEIYPKGKWRI